MAELSLVVFQIRTVYLESRISIGPGKKYSGPFIVGFLRSEGMLQRDISKAAALFYKT